jgi:hypothetical protein
LTKNGYAAHRKWPSDGVLDSARPVHFRSDGPELFDTDAVRLRLVVGVQIEPGTNSMEQFRPEFKNN